MNSWRVHVGGVAGIGLGLYHLVILNERHMGPILSTVESPLPECPTNYLFEDNEDPVMC